MTDIQTNGKKPTRKQVSKRDYLNEAGEVVTKMEEAHAARYSLLGSDHAYTLQVKGDDIDADAVAMFAVIGYHTKIGNVANTVLNDKDDPGETDDAAAAIEQFLDDVARGVWAEKTEGGGGAKVNRDHLAQAVMNVMVPALQAQVAAGTKEALVYEKVRAQLDSDKVFFRNMRQVPEIQKEYAKLAGTGSGKTVADVADLFA